VLVSMIFN